MYEPVPHSLLGNFQNYINVFCKMTTSWGKKHKETAMAKYICKIAREAKVENMASRVLTTIKTQTS
eukprot:8503086-Lingulodinium_polyedra.AAC.1